MKRSAAELKAYFETGDVPTQTQFEELFDSLIMPMCGIEMASNATATVINTANVFESMAGTINTLGDEIDMSAVGGLITYNGDTPRMFHLVSNLSLTVASNNQTISVGWFKNGTLLPVAIETRVGTGADIGTKSVHAHALVTNGDTLELKITNETSTANVTVRDLYAFAMGMFV